MFSSTNSRKRKLIEYHNYTNKKEKLSEYKNKFSGLSEYKIIINKLKKNYITNKNLKYNCNSHDNDESICNIYNCSGTYIDDNSFSSSPQTESNEEKNICSYII